MKPSIVCLVLAGVLACGKDSTTTPAVSIAGTYTLQTVGGNPLPYRLFATATGESWLQSSFLLLDGAGNCERSQTTYAVTGGAQQPSQRQALDCTYSHGKDTAFSVDLVTVPQLLIGSYRSDTIRLGQNPAYVYVRSQ